MKKKIFIVLALVFGISLIVKASFSLNQWQFYKDISQVAGNLAVISPDNEIYSQSNIGLTDLRIIDSANKETPYKLVTATDEYWKKDIQVNLLNNSIVSGRYTTAILNLGKRGIIANGLSIDTLTENFQRRIAVYGSDDQINWNTLTKDGYIYDFTDKRENVNSQKLSVKFSDSVFQYYKIEIAEADSKPVIITSARVSQYVKTDIASVPIDKTVNNGVDITQDFANKTTDVIVDLGNSGRIISSIKLTATSKNFNRRVSIFSSNDKAQWKLLGHGFVFNYDTPKFIGTNNSLNIQQSTERYFKLVVYNGDDAPLEGINANMFFSPQEIIFQGEEGNEYRIFYGNKKASAPQYDIESYFGYLDLTQSRKIELGSQQNNIAYTPALKPFSERIPFLFPVVLLIVGGLLIFLVYKFLKKQS